jgi:hypothetical protein
MCAVMLILPASAAAQTAPAASDGRTLSNEPAATQAAFQAAYGADAPVQWQREHNVAVRTDLPTSWDGQSLQSQSNDTRVAFIAAWGGQAPTKWVIWHTGQAGRAVILSGDLEEAIESAEGGDVQGAQSEFRQFSTAWENDYETLIRPHSNEIADTVAEQLHNVAAVLITPASPDKDRYLAELHKLADLIDTTQARLQALPPGQPVALAPPAAAAGASAGGAAAAAAGSGPKLSITIDTGELESSITGGRLDNLLRARGELEEFFEVWDEVKDAVQRENASAYNEITADLAAARGILLDRSRPTPAVADYLPVLEKALATVKKYQ